MGGLGVRSAVSLASSAYLASAAGSSDLIIRLLPPHLHQLPPDASVTIALQSWRASVDASATPPEATLVGRQRAWDEPCCRKVALAVLEGALDERSRARIL